LTVTEASAPVLASRAGLPAAPHLASLKEPVGAAAMARP